jgi:hypothetical protein
MTSESLAPTQKLAFAARILYQIVIGTTKISICFFNLRVFRDRVSRYCMIALIISISIFTIALTFSIIFQCIPIYSFWDITVTAVCRSQNPIIIASVVCNIVTDIILLAFVLWRISKLTRLCGPRRVLESDINSTFKNGT